MRKITALFVLGLLVLTGSSVRAQLSVRLQTEQDTFLLYEPIPVILAIQNFSGRPIELSAQVNNPWLSFVVTDENGNIVDRTKVPVPNDSVLIPVGQTVGHRVDLLPLYELRRRGSFRVQAYITGKGLSAASQPLRFTIMHGRELSAVTMGLPPTEGARDQYRTYSLQAHATQDGERLYALVRDDANQRVFELISLGNFVSTVKPDMRVDREGGCHVLFQSAPRMFGYALITSQGRMSERKVFSDYQSTPELVLRDGVVKVIGGEQ